MTKELKDITKQKFKNFEDLKSTGKYNTFDPEFREEINLTKEEFLLIIRNYDDLAEKYPDVVKD